MNDEQFQSFENLKTALCKAAVLYTPDYTKEFVIHCDASAYAVGCSLSQFDDDTGALRPIAFGSQKLDKTKQAYAVIEREAYSLIFALKLFSWIIHGSRILVYSDHDPLQYITKSAPVSAKLMRWSIALQQFELRVLHVAGRNNPVADMLSRIGQ